MPIKIYLLDSPGIQVPELPWGKPESHSLETLVPKIRTDIPAGEFGLLLAPSNLRANSVLRGLLDTGAPLTCLFFENADDLKAHANSLSFLTSLNRTVGVKDTLEKGSTIFSETLFNANSLGSKIDPCYQLALKTLGQQKAVDAWGTLHALIVLGIRCLPNQGANGTGERVDVQIGADSSKFSFSVRFDLPPEAVVDIRKNNLLELPRSCLDFFESRYINSGKKLELLGVSFLQGSPKSCLEAHAFHPATVLENSQEVKEYHFKGFGSLSSATPEEKRVIKGKGFKKKFSEQVSIPADAAEKPTEIKITAEKIVDADAGNFLVKGEVLQPTPSSGPVVTPAATMGKNPALLESKIQSLEATLKQRDELVVKLNKEIEDIKDPMKMGVISGIKDNQLEGLKNNITRLQGELAESQEREKELMSVVDKAIVMKDDAQKKYKELEGKLRTAQGGNNSKVVMLEKQLEEQKRQNQMLSKKVSQLTEQLQAAGKKVA